jgi:tetratricopeptide (TPR) repeat protein
MTNRIAALHASAASYFAAEIWEEAARQFDQLAEDKHLSASERVPHLISLANSGRTGDVVNSASPAWIATDTERKLVRRLAVSKAINEGRFDDAVALLRFIVTAHPRSSEDLATLASVLIRRGDRNLARPFLDAAAKLDPENLEITAQRVFNRLQTNEVAEAAALARAHLKKCSGSRRLFQAALIALTRAGDLDSASALIGRASLEVRRRKGVAEAVISVMLARKEAEQALTECEIALTSDPSPRLHGLAARACRLLGRPDQEIEDHLRAAAEGAPDDVSVLEPLAEHLLRRGHFEEAAMVTTRAISLVPTLANVHALHARALKHSQRHEEAANAMLKVVELKPGVTSWKRQAAATLTLAGRGNEAEAILQRSLDERRANLAQSFDIALREIETQIATAAVPAARIDWAWEVACRAASAPPAPDREKWTRRAHWGNLADILVLDWLECRPDRLEELTRRVRDVELVRDTFSELLGQQRGLLVASAHLGPLFSGPVVVNLAGLPMKCLASAPTVASSPMSANLISTSDRTDVGIVRAIHRALAENNVVIVAMDGSTNPAAPHIVWEGRTVPYTNLAPRISYHSGTPTIFAVPYWQGDNIRYFLKALPSVEGGEGEAAFLQRWQVAFFDQVRASFLRGPENLRLSGGLWRNVS